jgi:hypothetical protein
MINSAKQSITPRTNGLLRRFARKKMGLGKTPATTKTVIAPLDRAIQYTAASRFYRWRLWNTGSGDDGGVCFIHQGPAPTKAGTELAWFQRAGATAAIVALHPPRMRNLSRARLAAGQGSDTDHRRISGRRAPDRPSAAVAESFQPQMHGSHDLTAGTLARPETFRQRITCTANVSADDDFARQYFQVIDS